MGACRPSISLHAICSLLNGPPTSGPPHVRIRRKRYPSNVPFNISSLGLVKTSHTSRTHPATLLDASFTCNELQKKAAKREGVPIDGSGEREILIKAVRVNTLSKLTYSDTRQFLALIGDIFPGAESSDIPGVRKSTPRLFDVQHFGERLEKIRRFDGPL